MRERTRDLLQRGDKLFAQRYPILSLWQQLAENFHPMRADMTRIRYLSEEFASYLMTGRPALAHRDLSNALPALMRPRDRQWLWVRTDSEEVNDEPESRGYLDWMSRKQFAAMYDRRGGLVRATKECDGDYVAFGQAVMTVDPNEWNDGLLIRAWHLRNVAWTENDALQIDQVHHKLKIKCRDLMRKFPRTAAPDLARIMREDPDREINCRRIVVPVDDYDLVVKNKARFPFVSIYLDVDNDVVLEEVPQRTMIYVIPRWVTVSGSQYAYSPAAVLGLPDARMLQQITLTMLEASQKAVDPPLKAVTEAITGGVNTGAGMITWTDADYDERTGPVLEHLIQQYDGIQYGAAREERVEGTLDAIFFLNQIRMPQITKEMTAYEASKLYEEFQRGALPLLEPIEIEYNAGLCNACYEVMQGMGLFGPPTAMPEALAGREVRFVFDTPLKAAIEQQKVFAFSAVTDTVVKGMQVDETVKLNVDWDKGTRDAIIGAGGADWLLPQQKVAQLKQQQAQEAAAAAAAHNVATGADAASRVGDAVKSASDAASSLSQSVGAA